MKRAGIVLLLIGLIGGAGALVLSLAALGEFGGFPVIGLLAALIGVCFWLGVILLVAAWLDHRAGRRDEALRDQLRSALNRLGERLSG